MNRKESGDDEDEDDEEAINNLLYTNKLIQYVLREESEKSI